ncbi:GNAT family N-acetyltransferase [Pseudogemmobacter sonorensis]|uniref:GNAT family N-acetyltransferase n=1 Tax=Pseudogemmobacter sonorensis TaxID=2989681 RepID=UPI00369E0F4D
MSAIIRTARAGDEAAWRRLWAEYLAFYGVDLAPGVTDLTWGRILDPASALSMRLAFAPGGDGGGEGQDEGAMLGFATHHSHCSTWVAGEDCYLEDLFVAPGARGQGLGRALIDDLAALARARGCHRLYWHTDEKNARARALYDSYCESDGHIRYRFRL